jgi:HSP20 family molecular chaperone IbpA
MFELDPSIDANKISAKIDQGVVSLTLPKAEHAKPARSLFLKRAAISGTSHGRGH